MCACLSVCVSGSFACMHIGERVCVKFVVLQYGSISQMLRACAYGTPGIVSDVFNISEVFQCHKSACQGLMSS